MRIRRISTLLVPAVLALVLAATGCKKKFDVVGEISAYETGVLGTSAIVESVGWFGSTYVEDGRVASITASITFKVVSAGEPPNGSCLALAKSIVPGEIITLDCAYRVQGMPAGTRQDDGTPIGDDGLPFRVLALARPDSQ